MASTQRTIISRLAMAKLNVGSKAPDFTLPSASGTQVSLHDYAGRKVLLVFTQTGCGPCGEIIPERARDRLPRRAPPIR